MQSGGGPVLEVYWLLDELHNVLIVDRLRGHCPIRLFRCVRFSHYFLAPVCVPSPSRLYIDSILPDDPAPIRMRREHWLYSTGDKAMPSYETLYDAANAIIEMCHEKADEMIQTHRHQLGVALNEHSVFVDQCGTSVFHLNATRNPIEVYLESQCVVKSEPMETDASCSSSSSSGSSDSDTDDCSSNSDDSDSDADSDSKMSSHGHDEVSSVMSEGEMRNLLELSPMRLDSPVVQS